LFLDLPSARTTLETIRSVEAARRALEVQRDEPVRASNQ
jgi:hypothetical protein